MGNSRLSSVQSVHDQYAKVIRFLIEKQVKDEMPDLDKELLVIEIENRYKKLVHDYFKVPR